MYVVATLKQLSSVIVLTIAPTHFAMDRGTLRRTAGASARSVRIPGGRTVPSACAASVANPYRGRVLTGRAIDGGAIAAAGAMTAATTD